MIPVVWMGTQLFRLYTSATILFQLISSFSESCDSSHLITSMYFCITLVSEMTTHSLGMTHCSSTSCSNPTKQQADSGQSETPSVEQTHHVQLWISDSGMVMTHPPLSWTTSRIMKSLTMAGTRKPLAQLDTSENGSAKW